MCLVGTSKWRCGDLLEPRRACHNGYYLPWLNLCPYVHLVWNTFPINSALARSMSLSARSLSLRTEATVRGRDPSSSCVIDVLEPTSCELGLDVLFPERCVFVS